MHPRQFKKTIPVAFPEGGENQEEVYVNGYGQAARPGDYVMRDNGVVFAGVDMGFVKTALCKELDQILNIDITHNQLTILSGPSGSGKTDLAQDRVKKNGNLVCISRKDLRRMGLRSSKNQEKWITAAEQALAREAFRLNKDVIIDDSNLYKHQIERWQRFAMEVGFRYINVEYLRRSLQECIWFDYIKGSEWIGPAVINQQFLRHKLLQWGDGPVAIVDIDGTLSDPSHREHLVHGKKKNWPLFFREAEGDPPVPIVCDWLRALQAADIKIVLVSGRPINLAGKLTAEWLDCHQIPYDNLFMRSSGDIRPDTIVKQEILDQMLASGLKKEQILFAIDDRLGVIEKVWRGNGIRCIPVRCRDIDLA